MDISQVLSSLGLELLNDLNKYLDRVDENALSPIAALIGVKAETLVTFLRLIPKLINKEITLSAVVPSILPTLLSYFLSLERQEKSPTAFSAVEPDTTDGEDLKFIAGSVFSNLDFYEQNDNAS